MAAEAEKNPSFDFSQASSLRGILSGNCAIVPSEEVTYRPKESALRVTVQYMVAGHQVGMTVAKGGVARVVNTETVFARDIDTYSQRKLDHNVSNLEDASPKHVRMAIEEVIHRTQLGEFGSTEVRKNQVW